MLRTSYWGLEQKAFPFIVFCNMELPDKMQKWPCCNEDTRRLHLWHHPSFIFFQMSGKGQITCLIYIRTTTKHLRIPPSDGQSQKPKRQTKPKRALLLRPCTAPASGACAKGIRRGVRAEQPTAKWSSVSCMYRCFFDKKKWKMLKGCWTAAIRSLFVVVFCLKSLRPPLACFWG